MLRRSRARSTRSRTPSSVCRTPEVMRSDVCHARLVVRLGTKTRAKIDVAVASDDYRASVLRRRRPLR